MIDFLYTESWVLNYAFSLTGSWDEAKDIRQDVAMNLLRYTGKSHNELQKLARIAIKNRYLDLRKMRRTVYELSEKYVSPVASFEKRLLDKEKLDQVLKKLHAMPKRNREMFTMSIEGYDMHEIKDAFRENVNAVLSQIFRVRKSLRLCA